MAKLRWTAEALDWLEDNQGHIAEDNPAADPSVIDGNVAKAE